MSEVRLRFAPSPTGELHVGGLRTALFNYLYARKHGGAFVVRIEDTDRQRFVPGAEPRLLEMLRWAGITPDESPEQGGPYGPYRQSERLPRYHEVAERLIAAGQAYRCTCMPAELDAMRREQVARGAAPKYDGRCRALTAAQRAEREERAAAQGLRPVVRMHIPEREERIVVEDLVRGNVEFSSTQLDDQVLLKSDGYPTYHLAVVTDDHAMAITHVLRAEEWLPSTPKHLLLLRWLGWEPPRFAHLPLLLNPDRSKMSKRMSDVAAAEYRDQGYLPEALVNFLALLGWSPGEDRELFTLQELVREFAVERITKAGAVFDRAKLDWMNQHYIQQADPGRLFELLQPFLAAMPYAGAEEALLRRACSAVQPALVRLSEIGERLRPFLRDDAAAVDPAVAAQVAGAEARTVFQAARDRLRAMERLDHDSFQALMKEVQAATRIKGRALWGPMRAAITLEPAGPDLALMVEILGKEKTLARIERALAS